MSTAQRRSSVVDGRPTGCTPNSVLASKGQVMDPEAIQLLREIRDETRQTNARLDQTIV